MYTKKKDATPASKTQKCRSACYKLYSFTSANTQRFVGLIWKKKFKKNKKYRIIYAYRVAKK